MVPCLVLLGLRATPLLPLRASLPVYVQCPFIRDCIADW